jgi:hypothetical protein
LGGFCIARWQVQSRCRHFFCDTSSLNSIFHQQKKMSTSGAVYKVHFSEFSSPQSIATRMFVTQRSPQTFKVFKTLKVFLPNES